MTLTLESTAPVLADGRTHSLSPSALARFCTCPRQFFYQNILRLPDSEKALSARFGTVTHKILEVLNCHYAHAYTLDTVLEITKDLFEAPTLDARLSNLSITSQDMALIQGLGPVGRVQVQRSVVEAFENLAKSGYFDRPFAGLSPEIKVSTPPLPGFETLTLQGRIDLLRERPDGSLEIVDYKTNRKASQKAINAEIENGLSPFPVDLPWSPAYFSKRHLQLPLYWWMLRHTPGFEDKAIDITIQPVRPAGWGKAKVSCEPVTIPHSRLLEAQATLEETLFAGILTPLMTTTTFSTEGVDGQKCQYCDFSTICEGPKDDGDNFDSLDSEEA